MGHDDKTANHRHSLCSPPRGRGCWILLRCSLRRLPGCPAARTAASGDGPARAGGGRSVHYRYPWFSRKPQLSGPWLGPWSQRACSGRRPFGRGRSDREAPGGLRLKVSLVGWSRGGIIAREVARQIPAAVRMVIMLGSPFAAPSASNVRAIWKLLTGQKYEPPTPERVSRRAQPIPVPSTSIYTRADGVVASRACLEEEGAHPGSSALREPARRSLIHRSLRPCRRQRRGGGVVDGLHERTWTPADAAWFSRRLPRAFHQIGTERVAQRGRQLRRPLRRKHDENSQPTRSVPQRSERT